MEETIVGEYTERKAKADAEFAKQKNRGDLYGLFVGALAVMTARWFYIAMQGRAGYRNVWIALAATLVLGIFWRLIRSRERREMRVSGLYAAALDRVNEVTTQTGQTGEDFADGGHLYAWDLDVVGENSLFGKLATTRTAIGQRALAELLLEPTTAEAAGLRQSAVQELTPALDLREAVALLGKSKFEEIPAETYERWLAVETEGSGVWYRPLLIAVNVAWVVLVAWGFVHYGTIAPFARPLESLLLAQAMLCLWLRMRVLVELRAAKRLYGQTAILRRGLGIVEAATFHSERLVELHRMCAGQEEALGLLERWLMVVEHRDKEWFSVLTVAFCGGTHAAFGLRAWKLKYGEPMRRWLAAWSELEALLALGTYAAEHASYVYPEIVDGAATFEAKALVHPLLLRDEGVANNISLGSGTQFLLISGSNMAGKSTLLRAIGANAVLALAGAPVPAKTMKLSALRIGASLAIGDSLAEGKSKFLAEVERLRDVLVMARENKTQGLFLIDEIFSGTNSADRRAAAEAVVRGLVGAGAIGALSTHDLTLAELAEIFELRGRNVHMASPDEADPLGFDYLLKPGVNKTTNALAIVKLLGLSD
jgi:hypothetical protein